MYKDYNDYEILYMIGEKSNFNILYQKYQPLIYKTVKDYQKYFKYYGYEIDDLMQIGYLTLYKATCLYNSYNSSLFYTYFVISLKRAISNEIRLNKTYKKKCLNEAVSYDNIIPNTDTSYLDVIPCENKTNYNEEKRKFIYFKNSLSFVNSCVFEMLYNGFSKKEIALLIKEDGYNINACIDEIRKQKRVQNY